MVSLEKIAVGRGTTQDGVGTFTPAMEHCAKFFAYAKKRNLTRIYLTFKSNFYSKIKIAYFFPQIYSTI